MSTNLATKTLQPSPQEAAQELLTRRQARRNLQGFIEYTKPRWTAGKIHRTLCEQLERVLRHEIDRLMLLCPPQHGKQLAHSTPALTTSGWTTHGELRVGDYVWGSVGRPVEVIALSEESLSTLEFEFSDGERIRCHPNHEWLVYDRQNARKAPKVMEAKAIAAESLWLGPKGRRSGRARFSVDWVAIDGIARSLPVEPYALGAWLGDGTSSGA